MTMITEADLVWMTLIDKRMEFNLRWARERRQNAIDENRRPGNDAPIDFRKLFPAKPPGASTSGRKESS